MTEIVRKKRKKNVKENQKTVYLLKPWVFLTSDSNYEILTEHKNKTLFWKSFLKQFKLNLDSKKNQKYFKNHQKGQYFWLFKSKTKKGLCFSWTFHMESPR